MEFEPGIVKEEWEMILDFFENSFGKRPSEMEPILLMIGVQGECTRNSFTSFKRARNTPKGPYYSLFQN
jgi:hypothetical protein